jgi:16S rRNA (cytidine1402-2'-O)-methyltransferase
MSHAEAPVGGLVICPTPIGNLDDITLRALAALAAADVVACEDTRRTGRLLRHHAIEAALVSYHEHNEARRARELTARIQSGETVALVSDSGTPLISDPGYALLRACLEAGLPVEVLPGASAVTTALLASGLPPSRWCFGGFLPRTAGEREKALAGGAATLVAFESPRRLPATLELLARREPERQLAVCRELTKLHEEVIRGSASEVASHFRAHPPRGEVVIVCAPASAPHDARREQVLAALHELVDAGARPRIAAGALSSLTGIPANELYRRLTAGAQGGQ